MDSAGGAEPMTDLGCQHGELGGCSKCKAALVRSAEFWDKRRGRSHTLPLDSAERKRFPIYSTLFRIFPAALAAVSRACVDGSEKHNPGQPVFHDRTKSTDHPDCICRHLIDMAEDFGHGVGYDENGKAQAVAIAWRGLALLQEWLEKHEGAPLAPGAKL